MARVNTSIDNLDLEFRHLHDEHTGREMYALVTPLFGRSWAFCTDGIPSKVNRKGDEIAQMASHYSPAEIAFFRALVIMISRVLVAFIIDLNV